MTDTEGQDFASQDAARAEAIFVARELIGRSLLHGNAVDWLGAIEITAGDDLVETIGFRQAAGVPEN